MSISNHWLGLPLSTHYDRGTDTVGRRKAMDACRDRVADGFSWVTPPILNRKTRTAVVANARREQLLVQGWEGEAPATRVFSLLEHRGDESRQTTTGKPTAATA